MFTMAMVLRSVANSALASRVPQSSQRAGFLSLGYATQNFAAGGGAYLASAFLSEDAQHRLVGMDAVGIFVLASNALLPVLVVWLERLLAVRGSASD
jgi:hypothetical protein